MNASNSSSYRKLRFDSIQECIDEVHRIAQAQEQGTLKASGNWTAGEVLSHVAAWIEYGYVGYPIKPLPFFIRWLLRSLPRGQIVDPCGSLFDPRNAYPFGHPHIEHLS